MLVEIILEQALIHIFISSKSVVKRFYFAFTPQPIITRTEAILL